VIQKRISSGPLALGLLLALLMAGTSAWGQGEASKPAVSAPPAQARAPGVPKQEFPLHISAAQMEADQDKRVIIFKGQVKADYGDTTLYTDKLLVFYKPKEDTPKIKGQSSSPPADKGPEASPLEGLGGDQIDRIEAWGNVRCVQGDRVATGEKAIYYKGRDDIVLLGHPQVWRGENHVKGSRIIMNLATRKVEVEGSPAQRVEAHLYPSNQGEETSTKLPAPGGLRAVPRTGRPR
jgi:lipopolysaccharide export system protein LptA